MSKSEGYDPKRSTINDDKLAEFIRAPITGDLKEIPGLGPKGIEKLADGDEPITTTYQLIGKYLMLKDDTTDSVEHCDKFWYWLKAKGIDSHRSGLVNALAEKVNIFLPGTYAGNDQWES